MDPISFAASLLTLCETIRQINNVVIKISSGIRNSENEVDQAIEQLSTIRSSLEDLEKLKAIQGNSPDTLQLIANTESFLSAVEATYPKLNSGRSIRQRIRWVVEHRQAVAKLSSDFQSVASSHNLRWHFGHTYNLQQILQKMSEISSSQHHFNYQQEDIMNDVDWMRQVMEKQTERPESNPSKALVQLPQRTLSSASMRKWLPTANVMVLYWRSHQPKHKRKNQRQVVFGLVLPGSKVMLAHLSPSNGFHLNLRNIIPSGAEIVRACKAGDSLTVRSLLQSRKANPNDVTEENYTLLMHAIDSRTPDLVELLLQEGADANQTFGRWQTSPLQVAFETGQARIARTLLRHQADIHYLSARSWSVVSYLWERGEAKDDLDEFFEICGSEGFDSYDVGDRAGWSSLHRAAAYGKARDIQNILRLKGSFTTARNNAWTPIHVATALNNVQTLEALAEAMPISLHAPDARGFTPLHIAADRGAERTMEYLIIHGANPHLMSSLVANSFPVGFEHEAVTPNDLARAHSLYFWEKYIDALKLAKWNVYCCDDELFWDFEDMNDNGSDLLDEKTPLLNEKAASKST